MTPQGLERLKLDEGCRLSAYPDPGSPLAQAQALPLSHRPAGWEKLSGDPYTVGYGCTGPGIGPGTCWTKARAEDELAARVRVVEAALAKDLPWFPLLDPVRRDVLVNIGFNVGVRSEEGWSTTLGHIAARNYAAAADDLLHEGKWNRDVGQRAVRLANAMRSGAWPDAIRVQSLHPTSAA